MSSTSAGEAVSECTTQGLPCHLHHTLTPGIVAETFLSQSTALLSVILVREAMKSFLR